MSGLGHHIEYAQNLIAQVDAQHARDAARESAMSSDKTRKNTERLYLVVQAMWELLKDKAGQCSVLKKKLPLILILVMNLLRRFCILSLLRAYRAPTRNGSLAGNSEKRRILLIRQEFPGAS